MSLRTRPQATAAITTALASLALASLACSSSYGARPRQPRLDPVTGSAPPTTQWLATINPVPGTGSSSGNPTSLRGAAAVKRVRDTNSSRALLSLAGAAAGTQVAWQVQSGECNAPGQTVGGSPNSYPILTILPDGTAAADVGLPTTLSLGGAYSVTVKRYSSASMEPLACGSLVLTAP